MPATTSSQFSPQQLADYINQLLEVDAFNDYCPNGLQIDGGQAITRIVTGVTACEALIDAAIADKAQAILVHHGYFWKGEPAPLIGMKGKRVRKLMQHGISLLAYHLPLDAHPTLGNNAQLATALGLQIIAPLFPHEKKPVGNIARANPAITAQELTQRIVTALHREPQSILGTPNTSYNKIGICTGAAQDMLEQAALQGCDAFISGEISERTTHIAREMGIDYFAAGHHATEKGGILALGKHLMQQLDIAVNFIDIDNPV